MRNEHINLRVGISTFEHYRYTTGPAYTSCVNQGKEKSHSLLKAEPQPASPLSLANYQSKSQSQKQVQSVMQELQ